MSAQVLPEDLLDEALGQVVGELTREWRKDVERISAEARAIIAELKADIATLNAELLAKANEAIAGLKNGVDGRDGKDGDPGKDADPALVENAVAEAVAKAVGALELPAGPRGQDGKDGAVGPSGRDGADIASGIIDRDGNLALTLTDGSIKTLGVVVGKDGRDGRDGVDGGSGKDGRDGKDGLSFESFNLNADYDGERTLTLRWNDAAGAEQTRTWFLPLVLDKGVYRAGESYLKGDAVSFGGSMFIAQDDTADKPETSKAWRLAVKHGRDGKDGGKGERGPVGEKGQDGRNLTAIGPDGSKW